MAQSDEVVNQIHCKGCDFNDGKEKLLAKKLDYLYNHAPNRRKPKCNLETVEDTIYECPNLCIRKIKH
jgi:hypothetical protein